MSRRKWILIFVAVLCLPAATLAWLGLRLLDLDSALEFQRQAERRDQAADRAVQTLISIATDPALFTRQPGSGALISEIPGGRRLFHSQVSRLPEPDPGLFSTAEQLEIREGNINGATELYRKLVRSDDPLVRAGALLRLARTLRSSKQPERALRAYDDLEKLDRAAASGLAAPLAAAWGRCALLEAIGDKPELAKAANRLRAILDEGKWPITQAVYETFAAGAERWSGRPRPKDVELLTEAINRVDPAAPDGNRAVEVSDVPVTVLWRRTGDRTAIFAATPAYLEREWLARAGDGVWIKDEAGRDLTSPRGPGPAMRYAGQTRLPWTVAVVAPPPGADFARRSRLLLLLLAVVAVFSITGGYFVLRALIKEFALARMQEDFVAAVSHEFRTPLTTLRQIGESLEDGRISSEEHRNQYYRSISRATRRLHRLVEDLLDFRRMRSGAAEYRKAPLEVNQLVEEVVSVFQREAEGFRIALRSCPETRVTVDREALGRALWNLLDNAVKYSGESREIDVAVECSGGTVELSVRDRGMGIRPEEQARVFGKFYRGSQARAEGIRGTGIGLAMVKQIVEAHGGKVSVESAPGAGSTFTLAVPREENGWHAS